MTKPSDISAAEMILFCPKLAAKGTRSFIRNNGEFDVDALLAAKPIWSYGERILCELALDLYGVPGFTFSLDELVQMLDDKSWAAVQEALKIKREARQRLLNIYDLEDD